jgi:hypothetical protein
MKAAFLALVALGLQAQTGAVAVVQVPSLPPGPLVDVKDSLPLLLGPTTGKAILAHRAVFRDNLAQVSLSAQLRGRWQAIHQPFTLVAVFGSWCADSHLQLPDLLALEAVPTPFIEIRYLGVNRDKQLEPAAWPVGCAPQVAARVPTFYLFATQPGGKQQLVGSVVENPTRPGQTMAEALVELVEAVRP